MAKPRYIAPWHREGLEEADLEAMSAENVELLASLKGKLRAVGPSARSEALLRLVLEIWSWNLFGNWFVEIQLHQRVHS